MGSKILHGIYVGHSPSHSGSVALVLNPKTGHILPQYHVVFDESFTTVPYMNEHQVPPNWSDLVTNSRELVTDERVPTYGGPTYGLTTYD